MGNTLGAHLNTPEQDVSTATPSGNTTWVRIVTQKQIAAIGTVRDAYLKFNSLSY